MDAVKIEIVGMMVLIVGISILIKFLQIYILLILTGIGMLMQMSFMANHICFHLHWAMVAITPDYNPEIFVGRLLCSSRQDILNWTEKVIQYEQNPGNGDLNYLTKSFMIVSDQMEDNFTPNQAERVRSHLPSALNSGSTIWRELQNGHSGEGTVPQGPTFPTGSQIIAELNNHYGLFSTFAHGNKNGITAMSDSTNTDPWWIIQPMDEMNNNVPEVGNGFDNLTNNKFPTICYSVSCSPTPFDAFNNCPWFSGINIGARIHNSQ